MTDADLIVLIHDNAGHFEFIPLLDSIKYELLGKGNIPTNMEELNQHATKEEERVNGVVYNQPLSNISAETFTYGP